MNKSFTVEIRTTCKICGKKITEERYRSYCSKECRKKFNNKKNYPRQKEWAKQRRGAEAPGKLQCLVCGKWYVQIGSHVKQTHHMTAHEYKEEYDLPLKRGVIPAWYKEVKRSTITDDTIKNLLKVGRKTRYKNNDPKAKAVKGWKGRRGSLGCPVEY